MEKFRKKSTMVRDAVIIFTVFMGHFITESNSQSLSENEEKASSMVTFIEFDYEDQCFRGAEANWGVYTGRIDSFKAKMEADANFGAFSKEQVVEVDTLDQTNLSEQLARMIYLVKMPGDAKLNLTEWYTLVTYSSNGQNDLMNATDYVCSEDGSRHCTLSELQKIIATARNRKVLEVAKASWVKKLPNAEYYVTHVLPLLNIAAKGNNFTSVEEYWEALAEYPGAYATSRQIWAELEDLYKKLHAYVLLKLGANGTIRTDGAIPSYMLGSLLGDDWFNIAEVVVPRPALLAEIDANLRKKRIGGREAYKVAVKLLQSLKLGDLNERFWRESVFDKTCPAFLVDYCKAGDVKVGTCNDIGLGNLLDAQEIVMEVKRKEIVFSSTNNTYMIREANRYSAIIEALPGLASLLALTPEHLNSIGVLPLKSYHSKKNSDGNRITIQMLLALRDFPRLNYYLTADKWRLQMLAEGAGSEGGSKKTGWSQARSVASIAAEDSECLGDPFIVSNKPYIGKFLGTVLKYQLVESYTSGPYGDESDIVNHIGSDNQKLKSLLGAGYMKPWPLLMDDILSESTVSADALLNYFRPLDEFLDNELSDPHSEIEPDNYSEEEDIENYGIADSNDNEFGNDNRDETIPEPEQPIETIPAHEDDTPKSDLTERNDNKITDDLNSPIGEVTTSATLDNPHLVAKESIPNADQSLRTEKDQENIQQASTPIYVWIGLAAIIVIVVVLAAVIARKRCQHRRALEFERREGLKNTPA